MVTGEFLDLPLFRPILTIGAIGDTVSFGGIQDATWSDRGELVIGDAVNVRIYRVEHGEVTYEFGARGSGPGEFLTITRVVHADSVVFVYDDRQSRITGFDSMGDPTSSFTPSIGLIQDLDLHPDGSLVALRASYDGKPNLFLLSPSGLLLDSLGAGPHMPPDRPRDPFGVAGAICVSGSRIYYANPYVYEIAAYDLEDRRALWVRQYQSRLRSEMLEVEGQPMRPRALLLSLVCDDARIVLAYIDTETRKIHYDFLSASGVPRGRMTEIRSENFPYAGFLGGIHGDSVLTFANYPVPTVSIYTMSSR